MFCLDSEILKLKFLERPIRQKSNGLIISKSEDVVSFASLCKPLCDFTDYTNNYLRIW